MNEFPWMKVMKHDTFSKCTKYTTLISIIESTKDPVKRDQAIKTRNLHWQRDRTERRSVEATRNKSRQDKDFFFCEIDGKDSAKTIQPHFHTWDKNVDKKKLFEDSPFLREIRREPAGRHVLLHGLFSSRSANTIKVMYKTLVKVN